MSLPRLVVCAAIRNADGAIIAGARHFDSVMRDQIKRCGGKWLNAEQGFIDQGGRFMTREEALKALRRRQSLPIQRKPLLNELEPKICPLRRFKRQHTKATA